jgi:hypothetical protein
VLAIAGVALLNVLGQTSRTMRSIRDSERELREASSALERVAARDRAWLVAAIGRTTGDRFTVAVRQANDALFDVTVSRDAAILLHTTLYRPDTANARR